MTRDAAQTPDDDRRMLDDARENAERWRRAAGEWADAIRTDRLSQQEAGRELAPEGLLYYSSPWMAIADALRNRNFENERLRWRIEKLERALSGLLTLHGHPAGEKVPGPPNPPLYHSHAPIPGCGACHRPDRADLVAAATALEP